MNAWLITNEFLHTHKYTEINQWLVEAGQKQDIEFEIKTNAEVLAILGVDKIKPSIDFVLFWDKDIRLAQYLELCGYPVFNSSFAIAAADDKSMTHMLLEKAGLPMPKTIVAPMTYANIGYTNFDFLDQVKQELTFPMIVKECFGSFGMQVYFAKNDQELQGIVEKIGSKPMLFQECITNSLGKDVRIHVVGDQVVTAMYRYSDTGDYRANITNGGKMKPYEPSKAEKDLAIAATKALNLNFAGVDLLFGENGPLVCEVNSNAHFRNIFDCTGVNVADAIMTYLVEKAGK